MFWDISDAVLLAFQRKVRNFGKIEEPVFIEDWTSSKVTFAYFCSFLYFLTSSFCFADRSSYIVVYVFQLAGKFHPGCNYVYVFQKLHKHFEKLISCRYLKRLMSSTKYSLINMLLIYIVEKNNEFIH